MKYFKTHIILVAVLLTAFTANVSAQLSNSLYFLERVPQSNQLNPAVQPICNFYFSHPARNIELNLGNSAFSFNDVLIYDKSTDSLYWPIRNEQTKKDFLNKLKPSSFLFTDNRIDLITFGFRIKSTYLTFNVSERIEAYGYLPKDLFKLGMNFNQSSAYLANESFDMSNIGIKAHWYREFGLSISQEINPKLNFGIRAKLLYGVANISTSNTDIELKNTGVYQWQTRSKMEINTSIPGVVVHSTNNKPDSITTDKLDNIKSYEDVRNLFLNTKNIGFGLDIGVIVKPISNLSISASIVDLGFIRWKNNVTNFKQEGEYIFEGVNLNLKDTADMAEILFDTLQSVYDIKTNYDAFTTSLSGKLYAGIYYQVTKGFGFGAVTRLQLVQNMLRPQFTFSTCVSPGRGFALNLSYTIADGVYDNLGVGWALKIGPVQWYWMMDRIPLVWNVNNGKEISIPGVPAYYRSINYRSGINYMFGCRRKIKIDKDKPLIEI